MPNDLLSGLCCSTVTRGHSSSGLDDRVGNLKHTSNMPRRGSTLRTILVGRKVRKTKLRDLVRNGSTISRLQFPLPDPHLDLHPRSHERNVHTDVARLLLNVMLRRPHSVLLPLLRDLTKCHSWSAFSY